MPALLGGPSGSRKDGDGKTEKTMERGKKDQKTMERRKKDPETLLPLITGCWQSKSCTGLVPVISATVRSRVQ